MGHRAPTAAAADGPASSSVTHDVALAVSSMASVAILDGNSDRDQATALGDRESASGNIGRLGVSLGDHFLRLNLARDETDSD